MDLIWWIIGWLSEIPGDFPWRMLWERWPSLQKTKGFLLFQNRAEDSKRQKLVRVMLSQLLMFCLQSKAFIHYSQVVRQISDHLHRCQFSRLWWDVQHLDDWREPYQYSDACAKIPDCKQSFIRGDFSCLKVFAKDTKPWRLMKNWEKVSSTCSLQRTYSVDSSFFACCPRWLVSCPTLDSCRLLTLLGVQKPPGVETFSTVDHQKRTIYAFLGSKLQSWTHVAFLAPVTPRPELQNPSFLLWNNLVKLAVWDWIGLMSQEFGRDFQHNGCELYRADSHDISEYPGSIEPWPSQLILACQVCEATCLAWAYPMEILTPPRRIVRLW